jgi:hypothetical protein
MCSPMTATVHTVLLISIECTQNLDVSSAYDHRAVMQQTSKAAALHVKPASIQYGTHSYHVLITSVVYSQTQEQPM